MSAFYPTAETFYISVSSDPAVTLHGVRGGSGPPLLLVHGFPQTHIIFHKVFPALSQHYTVVIPDLRGYGKSSKPPAPASDPNDHTLYGKTAMAVDLANLMKALGFSSFFVCGHDRGARVTHRLLMTHGQLVRKAMLLDICPTAAMYGASHQAFATAYWHWFFLIQSAPFPENILCASAGTFIKKQVAGMHAGAEVFGEAAMREYEGVIGTPEGAHATCEDYRAAATVDIEEQRQDIQAGRQIQTPLRVLWGKFGVCERLFDCKGEWEKVSKPGVVDKGSCALECGHYIPEERPEELVQHILDFLRDDGGP